MARGPHKRHNFGRQFDMMMKEGQMKNFRGPFSPTQGSGNPKFLEHSHAKKTLNLSSQNMTRWLIRVSLSTCVNMCIIPT